MGMFSWDCNACGFAMRDCCDCAKDGWMGEAVCLTPDGSRVIGHYDHYGKLGSYNLVDQRGPFAIYHKACWELAGRPEYDKPARHSRDQGACLHIHGEPLPQPRSPEWFTVARTWEAIERVLLRYAKLRSDCDREETERLWESLAPDRQLALCATFEAAQNERAARYRAAYDDWSGDAPMPEPEANPKTFAFDALIFNYAWLDVVVYKATAAAKTGHP